MFRAQTGRMFEAVGPVASTESGLPPAEGESAAISGPEQAGRDRVALASCCESPLKSQWRTSAVRALQFPAAQIGEHQGAVSSARVIATARPQAL